MDKLLGYLDDDGFLHITGHTSRVLIRFDHKISIDSIEQKIKSNSIVSDCAIIPIIDDYINASSIAFISLQNNSKSGQSIEKRPKEIKNRGSFGHWKMDSVMGCKGSQKALLVLTERRTRMGIIMLLEDHTAASVVKAINSLEWRFGKLFYKLFKSITVDNGCEFQGFEGIEMAHRRKGKRTIVFFCRPYSAYERGSNENMNRLIRRFFPKGTNFDDVTKEQVAEAERWVNNYPRKLLGWKSAATLFEQELRAA